MEVKNDKKMEESLGWHNKSCRRGIILVILLVLVFVGMYLSGAIRLVSPEEAESRLHEKLREAAEFEHNHKEGEQSAHSNVEANHDKVATTKSAYAMQEQDDDDDDDEIGPDGNAEEVRP